jgi:hypothetical protein
VIASLFWLTLAAGLARVSRADAPHVFPLGAEAATREVAAEFR